jgi:hypothetical protein
MRLGQAWKAAERPVNDSPAGKHEIYVVTGILKKIC